MNFTWATPPFAHAQMLGLKVDVVDVEPDEFADPDPRAEKHLDHDAVAAVARRCAALEFLEEGALLALREE